MVTVLFFTVSHRGSISFPDCFYDLLYFFMILYVLSYHLRLSLSRLKETPKRCLPLRGLLISDLMNCLLAIRNMDGFLVDGKACFPYRLCHRRVAVDGLGELLQRRLQLDGQSGFLDEFRGAGGQDVHAEDLATSGVRSSALPVFSSQPLGETGCFSEWEFDRWCVAGFCLGNSKPKTKVHR